MGLDVNEMKSFYSTDDIDRLIAEGKLLRADGVSVSEEIHRYVMVDCKAVRGEGISMITPVSNPVHLTTKNQKS